ncbi:MAG TPA: hypothetical protein VGI96_19640 [Streptosporangiaceae bacterium]
MRFALAVAGNPELIVLDERPPPWTSTPGGSCGTEARPQPLGPF